MFDFIDPQSPDIELPTPGEGFKSQGFIAPFVLQLVWKSSIYSELDLTQSPEYKPDDYELSKNGKFVYYWNSRIVAEGAQKLINDKFNEERTDPVHSKPGLVLRLKTHRDAVINIPEDQLARFGEVLAFYVDFKTPKSKKYRHGYQLIALPGTIQAAALSYGLLSEPVLDFGALELAAIQARTGIRRLEDNTEVKVNDADIFTDQFFAELAGDPDGDTNAWQKSVLGEQRIALWNALGETNPNAYTRQGRKPYAATPGTKFYDILQVIEKTWVKPTWCRVVTVADPRVGAFYVDGDDIKRRSIPYIETFFANEDAARIAAAKDLESRDDSSAEAVATTTETVAAPVTVTVADTNGAPPIPASWATVDPNPEKVKELLLENLSQFVDKTNAEIAEALDISVPEAIAWKNYSLA